MLIEVHIIQNHAPSNLNRDESGSPKSAYFGGYRRARISSQCLKRAYRTSKTFRDEVDKELGMHTTSMPDEVIRRVLNKGVTLSPDEKINLKGLLKKVIKRGGGDTSSPDWDDKTKSQEVDKSEASKDRLKTAQSVFWRERELDTLAEGIKDWAGTDRKKDFDPKIVLKPAGLGWAGIPIDMALFGRMITSDLMHNIEASSQFAHAISTHEFTREFDLWTRVDDRRDKRLDWYRDAFGAEEKLETGTDGMGDAEFTSACFYSYFNMDFDALTDNLTGKAINNRLQVTDEDQKKAKNRACNAVIGLLKAAIFERPTGKFNSMATPSLPALVLVEIRDSHVPVSYTDAFAKPVDPKNEETFLDNGQIQHVDLPIESATRLIKEANRITTAFCRSAVNRLLFTGGRKIGTSLDELDSAPVNSVDTVQDLIAGLRGALGCPQEKKDV
jgi:CRISPR system Cascade subunit CasC